MGGVQTPCGTRFYRRKKLKTKRSHKRKNLTQCKYKGGTLAGIKKPTCGMILFEQEAVSKRIKQDANST